LVQEASFSHSGFAHDDYFVGVSSVGRRGAYYVTLVVDCIHIYLGMQCFWIVCGS